MKYLPVFLVGVCLVFLPAFSCVSTKAVEAHDAFADAYDAAMEDGVVTSEEAKTLKLLGDAWIEASRESQTPVNWELILGQTAGTVLMAIFGANFVRNRNLPGTTRLPT